MRNRHVLLLDLPAISIAAYGAFVLRFDWLFVQQRHVFFPFLIAAMLLKPFVFYVFGIYARYWQYASIRDMVVVFLAVAASSVGMAVVVALEGLAGISRGFPRSIVFIDWLLTLVLIGTIRLSIRAISDQRTRNQRRSNPGHPTKRRKRVLIIGAGVAGSTVARELHRNPDLGMTLVGYLDDDRGKIGTRIQGVRVLGDRASLGDVVTLQRIDEVVIAMPRAPGAVVRKLEEDCRRHGVESRIVPGVFELLDGYVSIDRLRRVEIADLLRRRQIARRAEPCPYVAGRRVLVTGAGGSIGRELCRQIAFSDPKELVLLGHGENSIFSVHLRLAARYRGIPIHSVIADVRDSARLNAMFDKFKPEVVYHAAAHKHVPLMEANPEEALTTNVGGTLNVVQACDRCAVQRLVYISTDKAVAPSSIMGASKRLGEQVVMEAGRTCHRSYVVVRFGNVLGSRGSVVPILQSQIERGGPVTITHPEMKRFFMTVPEAVHLVLLAGGMGEGGELFVLNMGEQLKVIDVARDLIRLSGVDPATIPIEIIGVRPGEKLEEQLWEEGAIVEVTQSPDIFRIRENERAPAVTLRALLDDVLAAAERADLDRLHRGLALAVPGYGAAGGGARGPSVRVPLGDAKPEAAVLGAIRSDLSPGGTIGT